MAVYVEWFWSCDICGEHNDEPWGDPQDGEKELSEHLAEMHAESPEASSSS